MHTLTVPHESLLQVYESRFATPGFPKTPEGLYQPVNHIMNIKGKRIRPLLLMMACDAFGGTAEDALGPAYAVEVFHNFTLVHDDIMDNADLRRGVPTVHNAFGVNRAILAGDVMLSFAYKYLAEGPSARLADLLSIFTRTAIEVMEGQQLDMDFETRLDVNEEEYLHMIRYKTSVLLAASLELGAIIGGASEADRKNIYEFGLNLGLSFQIKDDYLDTFGDGKKVGKKIGGDILNNKKTYLLITALNNARGQDKEELLALLNEKNEEKKISGVIAMFEKLGVRESTLAKAEELYRHSIGSFSALSVPGERKRPLLDMAEMIYLREF